MAAPPEIQDLVDSPSETLHVELKAWINIADEVARAKTARHLAALANHGGGYLIIGFNDDGTQAVPPPGDVTVYTRDAITGIIDRYLVPAFQCDCFLVSRTDGSQTYPVVRVSSHKSVPICSKKDGPQDAKNNPEGIRKGRYYIRVPGPKSVAIETPEQWRELIHRCVVNERESLLRSFNALISGPQSKSVAEPAWLANWHDQQHQQYLAALSKAKHPWPVSIAENHYQFSYRIVEHGGKTKHTADSFREALRIASEAVRSIVWTGWSMFHVFTRREIAPRILIDHGSDEEIECFEANLLEKTTLDTTVPDFWLITFDGRATIIRPYREDRVVVPHLERHGLVPGNWLSPRTLVREVYEVATHAKELAKAFEFADTVEFRCSWYGLKERQLAEFEPGVDWREGICHEATRTTAVTTSTDQLTVDTAAIVMDLAGPVLRLFDGLETTPEWINQLRPRFRML